MKKSLAAFLALILLFSVAACKGKAEPAASTPPGTDAADPTSAPANEPATEITVYFLGATVTNDADVRPAVNARLKELGLNITVNPIWGDWGAGALIQSALDTGDNTLDVVFTCSWAAHYVPNARKGNFLRLDDPSNNLLEKYGQDMMAAVPSFLWDGFNISTENGAGIYAVPGYKDYAQLYAWDINNTKLAELGYDIDSFNWSGDVIFDPRFEEVLKAAKDKYGAEFYPFMVDPDAAMRMITNNDADYTGLGVFYFGFDPNDPSKPERPEVKYNMETEEYKKALTKLHDFYNKGYVDPRNGIREEASDAIIGAQAVGNYLFSNRVYAYGYDVTASAERGIDAKFMPMSKPIVSTTPVQGSAYAIPVYSQHKDQAMQFLNAWYTDPELAKILCYGVEGIHYTTNADSTITLNQDKRAEYAPWTYGMGNLFIQPPQDINGPNFFEEFKAYNDAGVGTAFLGFTFDTTEVENEMAALASVRDEYNAPVTSGVADPSTQMQAFLDKLKANGSDKVLAEINRQLDIFFANKN